MFNQVTIVGTGLLGGSLARDLREQRLARLLVGVCRSSETAQETLDAGVVDVVLPLTQAVQDADLVVLATPMQAMLSVITEMRTHLPPAAIITDVGSVKTDLYNQLKQQVPDILPQFVLAHPIAGGENSGVSASKLKLFQNKHVIITQTTEVDVQMTSIVVDMWQRLGAHVLSMSLQEHDAIFAKTSHLPHVIAFSLVNFLSHQPDRERLFDLAAAGFYDFTRIASSNAEMWRDICVTNREQVLAALDGFHAQIEGIRDLVANADQAAILEYFGAAKAARDAGLIKRAEAIAQAQDTD
ncbi:oxidoreductase [Arenicella chitinivorans]|uniref:prephenate dehydrogenase n=1 Tax=Arenicella chitinivorans TaxID=1329800 RepID=A0A918RHT4_9GAMM|nr:prephenate dehydrogenase/arogenate dehydrogenase family protein [Arenicella chitinivorans]GGZ99416.1 oxidoreductase [Arenicella chitinivorans]